MGAPLQSRCQPLHGYLPVAVLGPGFGRLDYYAGRQVPDPYPGVCGVAVLAPRTRGAEEFDGYVGVANLYAQNFLILFGPANQKFEGGEYPAD